MTATARFYDVNAMSFNWHTGEVLDIRVERVDADENPIFRGCSGPWEIEDRYEAFWNRLNDSWEYEFPPNKEKVKVLEVTPVVQL